MKPKQLADVFIKILGLYFAVDGSVRIISGVLNLLVVVAGQRGFGSAYVWLNPFTGLILAVIGFLFIVFSRELADLLIKDE